MSYSRLRTKPYCSHIVFQILRIWPRQTCTYKRKVMFCDNFYRVRKTRSMITYFKLYAPIPSWQFCQDSLSPSIPRESSCHLCRGLFGVLPTTLSFRFSYVTRNYYILAKTATITLQHCSSCHLALTAVDARLQNIRMALKSTEKRWMIFIFWKQ